jgi:hypothetical protein
LTASLCFFESGHNESVITVSVALPYQFDTSPVVKVILRGALGLLVVVVVPGVLYCLFFSHNKLAAVQLLLVGGVTMYFGRLIHKNLEGSQGTISADAVVVLPSTLYGIPLSGPAGRFPIQQFKAVRVQLITAPVEAQGQDHERVCLLGKDGTPNILVARTEANAGRSLGRELSAALSLPYEEERAPY